VPAEKAAGQPASPAAEPSAPQSTESPARPVAEKATASSARQPATEPADKPAEKPAKKEAPVAKTTEKKTTGSKGETSGRGPDTGKKVVAGANALRARIASIVWLIAVICAAVLAVGALIYALGFDGQNPIVKFILDLADKLDFGHFKDFKGNSQSARTKEHLVDWGIAAVIYLVVGKILDRIIRP
jgi:hypothetical protein